METTDQETSPAAASGADLLELARRCELQQLESRFTDVIAENPGQLNLFLQMGEILRGLGKGEKAGQLLALAVEHYEAKGTIDERVRLLTFLAATLPKERNYRLALIQALKSVHSDKKALEVFLDPSGLKGTGDVFDAMDRLESMFAYDIGCYVLHGSGWGIGRVEDMDAMAGELVVQFEGGKRHQIPVNSALDVLQPIDADDWRALRAFNPDRLREMCEEDPGSIVANILRQTKRPMDAATFKHNLSGKVIPADKWGKWWARARREALKRSDVGQPDRGSRMVFQKPTRESDPFAQMREVMTAGQVLELATAMLRNMTPEESQNGLLLQELVDLMRQGAGRLARPKEPAPLELLLLADEVAEEHGFDREPILADLRNHFGHTFIARITRCKVVRLQKRALAHYRALQPELWKDQWLAMCRHAGPQLLDHLAGELVDAQHVEPLQVLLAEAIKQPDELPDLVVWAFKRVNKPRYAEALKTLERRDLLNRSLSLGEQVGKRANARLKKLQTGVAKDLINNNARLFREFLQGLKAREAELFGRRLDRLRHLSADYRATLQQVLLQEHAHLVDEAEELQPHDDIEVIYTTDEGKLKYQEIFDKIVNEDLPRIFEAIGTAAGYGDLSENAEYTAALEERQNLTAKAEKMREELRKAKPIDSNLLVDGVATIGTRMRVKNSDSGEELTYTVMGPWDADLDNGILDYHAPLAKAFLGNKAGANVEATFGGKIYHYQILSVEPAL